MSPLRENRPITHTDPAVAPAAAPLLLVHRLLVDLRTPPQLHWNGGDAFRTALFNALSMGVLVGEQVSTPPTRGTQVALRLPSSGPQAASRRAAAPSMLAFNSA